MARSTIQPLTPEQAKARFREVAHRSGISGWTRSHPYNATLLSLAAGLIAGKAHNFNDELSVVLINSIASLIRKS